MRRIRYEDQIHTRDKREVGFAELERLAGEVESVEGGGAGCVESEGRAFETVEPGDAVGSHGFGGRGGRVVADRVDVLQGEHFVVVGHAADVAAGGSVEEGIDGDAGWRGGLEDRHYRAGGRGLSWGRLGRDGGDGIWGFGDLGGIPFSILS